MRRFFSRLARFALVLAFCGGLWSYLTRGLDTRPPNETRAAPPAQDVSEVVDKVNAELRQVWDEQKLEHAPPAEWQVVCRRVALALIGTGLSLEELRALEQVPESERIDDCVNRLLQDERHYAYWAERWARTYVGNEPGQFLAYRRRKFVSWLNEQVKNNRPYDAMVSDLLTSKGFMTDQPAVNFITFTLQGGEQENQPDPVKLAARTSRAVLGSRIDCLQCHDDFLENVWLGDTSAPRNGTQADFHGLAAFFAPARFKPLQGIRDEDRPYRFKYLHENDEQVVEPAVPFAEELLPDTGPHRDRLARWATHKNNQQAMRAAVGRIWAFVFGRPLTASVDDIPLHGPLPAGLDQLAKDFAAHDCDVRRLVQILTRLDVFRMDSRIPGGVTPEHEAAWAVFPLIPLRPEQVAGAIVQACRLSSIDRETSAILQLQAFGDQNDFITRYGDTGEDEFKQDAVTITQRLLVMNGKLVNERTEDNPLAKLNASAQIAALTKDNRAAVEAAFLATLNRLPSAFELESFSNRMVSARNRFEAVQDLYWMLLNSTEFAWNH